MSGARLANSSVDLAKKMLTGTFAALALTACQKAPEDEPQMLAITGYNYTDRYIDGFSVNGQGGSNVLLSDDSDGGGKTTCCIVWRPGTALLKRPGFRGGSNPGEWSHEEVLKVFA